MRRFIVAAVLAPLAVLATAGAAPAALDKGGSGPTALYPDIQTVVPQHLQIQNQQQRDVLRFTNGIANTGPGPWALRPEPSLDVAREQGLSTVAAVQELWDSTAFYRCGEQPKQVTACHTVVSERVAGAFEFHPAHNHWHIGSVALFGVHTALDDGSGGAIGPAYVNDLGIAQSFKTTFCLIDWVKIDAKKKTPDVTYWACDRTAPYQGVSVGWIDQYHHSLEGQEIDLTGAPVGIYYLRVHANDDGVFVESDTTNNVAWVSFALSRESNGNPKVTLVSHSPCDSPNMCGEDLPNR
jgi:hypothetical protein